MEHILLIDTSAQKCNVGLVRDGQLLHALVHEDRQSQAAVINPMIEQLFKDAGVQLSELSAIAVCSGPGSYTGLRIGLAAAKGLAFGLEKPLILQHKLELIAQQFIQMNHAFWHYVVLITARENEFFYACYDADMNIVHQPIHADTEKLKAQINLLSPHSLCIVGDEQAQQIFGKEVKLQNEVQLSYWAEWATKSLANEEFADIAFSEPFYMKEVFIYAPRERGENK
jgi:tRNA threonylcarbamoyladenosine biosynthesis protein TsaB